MAWSHLHRTPWAALPAGLPPLSHSAFPLPSFCFPQPQKGPALAELGQHKTNVPGSPSGSTGPMLLSVQSFSHWHEHTAHLPNTDEMHWPKKGLGWHWPSHWDYQVIMLQSNAYSVVFIQSSPWHFYILASTIFWVLFPVISQPNKK